MIIFPLPPCVLVKSALVAGDSIVSPFTDDAVGAVHGNFELAFAYCSKVSGGAGTTINVSRQKQLSLYGCFD